jgi:putative copper export protein
VSESTVLVLQIIVHWVHVLSAILWVGGFAVINFMVFPSIPVLPPEQQRRFGRALAPRLKTFFSVVSGVVMLFGLIRGTLLGPIKGLDILFGSAYGLTFLAALILTIGLGVIGARVVGPTAERMYGDDSLWDFGPGQPPSAGLLAHVQLLRTVSYIEVLGFLLVFTMMILMRFGL